MSRGPQMANAAGYTGRDFILLRRFSEFPWLGCQPWTAPPPFGRPCVYAISLPSTLPADLQKAMVWADPRLHPDQPLFLGRLACSRVAPTVPFFAVPP